MTPQQKWAAAHPDYQKEYYRKNADRYKAKSRKRYYEDKDRARHYDLITKYGMTAAVFQALFEEQHGVCDICKKEQIGRSLSVDHCHITGNNRGLLCNSCNNGIGRFKDDPDLLIEAANYLKRYRRAS